jgi:hypothetical protein
MFGVVIRLERCTFFVGAQKGFSFFWGNFFVWGRPPHLKKCGFERYPRRFEEIKARDQALSGEVDFFLFFISHPQILTFS